MSSSLMVPSEPSFPWKDLVRLLQGEMFKGRVRLLLTSRTTYFEQDLRSLRSVAVRPDVIRLGSYDQTPGGEFDQILALYGTSRAAIHSSLHSLAATPRLLPLVVRLAGTPALPVGSDRQPPPLGIWQGCLAESCPQCLHRRRVGRVAHRAGKALPKPLGERTSRLHIR